MIETLAWIFIAFIGLAISASQMWLLAGKRPLTRRGSPERIVANSYMVQELIAQAAYVAAIIVGIVGAAALLDNPAGWNWTVLTEGTRRGIFINYGLAFVLACIVAKNAVRRMTWHKVSE